MQRWLGGWSWGRPGSAAVAGWSWLVKLRVFFFWSFVFFYLAPSLIFLIHVTRNKEKTHCGLRFSSFFFYLFIYLFPDKDVFLRLNFWEVSLSSERSKVFFSLKKTVWWTWNCEKDTTAKTHQETVTSYLKLPLFLQSTLFSCCTSRRLKSFSPIYYCFVQLFTILCCLLFV